MDKLGKDVKYNVLRSLKFLENMTGDHLASVALPNIFVQLLLLNCL